MGVRVDCQGRRADPGELIGSVLTFGGACGGEGQPDRMGAAGDAALDRPGPRPHRLGELQRTPNRPPTEQ